LKVERSKLLNLEKSRLPKVTTEMLEKSNMQKHDAKNENINTYRNHNAYNV
jgi:hypothetical protein